MGTKKGRRNIRKNNGRTKKRAIRRPLSKRKEGKKTIRKHKGHKGKNTTRRKRLSGGMFGIGDNKYIRETINGISDGKIYGKELDKFKAFFNKPGNQKYKSTRIKFNNREYEEFENYTPLHIAIICYVQGKNLEDIIKLLASGEEGEKAKSMKSTFIPPYINKYFDYHTGEKEEEIFRGNGGTPLYLAVKYAVKKGLPTDIIKLLSSGEQGQLAKIIEDDIYHNTPLQHAVNYKLSDKIIEILAGDRGEEAKVMKDPFGDTPIHHAIEYNSSEKTIEILALGDGGDKSKSTHNNIGNTPLHHAIEYKSSDKIIEILALGDGGEKAKVMKNNSGFTPLLFAVKNDYLFDIIKLLASGEGEKAKSMASNYGNTPLHIALKKDEISDEIITILASGKDGEKAKIMQNNDGNTPLQIAVKNNLSDKILNLLNPNASVEVDETSPEIQPTNKETYGFDGDQLPTGDQQLSGDQPLPGFGDDEELG
jgi:ankyrin repeat protein